MCRHRSTDRSSRRQSFSGGRSFEDREAVHHLTHDHRPLAARGALQVGSAVRQSPFIVGQVARISQRAAVVTRTVLPRPHRRPLLESGHHSWITRGVRAGSELSGRTLGVGLMEVGVSRGLGHVALALRRILLDCTRSFPRLQNLQARFIVFLASRKNTESRFCARCGRWSIETRCRYGASFPCTRRPMPNGSIQIWWANLETPHQCRPGSQRQTLAHARLAMAT